MDNDKATKAIDERHDCTCYPDEAPVPCQHRYALTECRLSYLEAENARLREALGNSVTAIDDWLNLYAPDHCDETRVEEAKMRVHEHGTLYYIAIIQEANLAALAPPPPP